MSKRRLYTLPVLIVLLVVPSLAQEPTTASDPVDDYIRAEMQKQKIPGLALLVAREGKTIKTRGYGLCNIELNVPVEPETIFQSGSVGKQFTATAVMMLVEQGKINLDHPITEYLKEGPPAWNQVTVRELLSHTAGFTDYPKDFDMRRDYTEDQLLKIVERIPLAYPPGTNWAYSNLGYLTLGVLIHRVTGEFYGDFLQQHIFQSLGMTTTRIISERDIIPNRAAGYELVDGKLKNQEWVSPTLNTTADGSLYFSVLDLARWDAALYTDKLLKRSSLDQMWSVANLKNGNPNSGKYGFGWFIEDDNGHRDINHTGSWQGFESHITRFVNDKFTVIVLDNLAGSDPKKIARGIADLYFAGKMQPFETAPHSQ